MRRNRNGDLTMARRRCCCGRRGCPIIEDDFHRASTPTTDLGPKWQELSGDWSINFTWDGPLFECCDDPYCYHADESGHECSLLVIHDREGRAEQQYTYGRRPRNVPSPREG